MRIVQIFLGSLGRVLLSLIFILSAFSHILDWQGSLTTLRNALEGWAKYAVEMPDLHQFIERLLLRVPFIMGTALIFMLIGGLFVFFGIKTRFGAFLLIIFLVGMTITMHPFWHPQVLDKDLQMTMFMKNLSILGGLLYLLAFGNGHAKPKKPPKPAPQESK